MALHTGCWALKANRCWSRPDRFSPYRTSIRPNAVRAMFCKSKHECAHEELSPGRPKARAYSVLEVRTVCCILLAAEKRAVPCCACCDQERSGHPSVPIVEELHTLLLLCAAIDVRAFTLDDLRIVAEENRLLRCGTAARLAHAPAVREYGRGRSNNRCAASLSVAAHSAARPCCALAPWG